jgi:hypothetical protein
MAKWLDKYEQGGLVLKKKTKDNFGKKANPNDVQVSVGPDFVGLGYNTKGRDYSPAWGGQFQDGGSIPTDKKSQQFYNTLKDYYSASDRTEAEKAQYAAFQRLNEAHGYAPVAIKNKTIAGKRSMINPFNGRLNLVAEANPEVGEIKSTPQKLMDEYMTEYSHYQQYNQNPEESKLKKTGRFLGHMAKDFGQMFKNTKGLNFGEAYNKNYVTPGTTEYEAHQVIQPKLQNELANYYGQEWTKNRGRLQMGGGLPGATGHMYARYKEGGNVPGDVDFSYPRTINPAPANGKYTKKTLASAQLGIELMPNLLSSAANIVASIPTMEEVKKKATDVIKNSPKLRSVINKGISYVANTDWGKEKIKNFANNIDPHGYGNGYLRDMTTRSPFDRIYSAAVLNKKEDSRKEMDSLLAAGKADPGDSLRIDLINRYAGLPQKYNTVKPSAYKPTMGNKNDKYYSSPIIERQLLSDIDLVAGNVKMKPVFKTKQDLQNFVQKHFGGEKGKGDNYVTPIEGLGTATTGVGEDEQGHYLSYYDNWDLNPYHGVFSQSDDSFEATNDKLGRVILGSEKEDIATKKIGNPTQMYGRIYFDKKTGKPKMKKGGVIKDDMGQWAHPGEVTEIGSNNITMQGVDYPVLGVSDTGDTQMMYPDQDYKFDGEKVTEFPVMEKGGWLDKFDDNAQKGKSYVSMKNNKDWFDSHANWSNTGNKQYDDLVRKSVLSGRFGVDPNTGDLIKLKESEWTDVSDMEKTLAKDKRNWTKKEKQEAGDLFNSMTPEGKQFRKDVVAGNMQAMFQNPLFYAPAAIAAAPFVAGAASAAAPILGASMNAPMFGVAGLTGTNSMNAYFAYQAAKNLPNVASSIKTAYQNPTLGNLGNAALETGLTTLDALPFASSVTPGVKAAISASKESGLLSNAYKINPFAFKPKSDAYYRMVGEGGYADALESGVVRPPVGSGHTEAYYNKGYPLDTRLRDATGRAGYGGPYMAEVKGDPELFVNENVANYTGPMFADPVVYSKQNIPINNPNLKFYKEDWLRGYKEVPKPTGSEATQNIFIPKPIDDIFKSVGSYYQEKLGETFAGAKNRAAIKEGNEWFQNWIDDPLTKNKIKNQIIDQQLLGKRAPLVSDRINDPNTMQDWGYLTSYRAGAKEYPLVYQKNDLIDFLKGHKRYNTPMIHADNWGVSYRHGQPYSWDTQQIYGGDRTSGGGTWVSRSLDIPQVARTSTTVHENTHDWLRDQAMERLGYKDLILKNMNQDAATNWADFSIHRDVGKNPIGYLADPTEVHARIMEARKHFGLTPAEYVSEERAKDMLERIGKGRSPISRRFPEIFDNPKQAALLFNRLPAVAPVAVGAGALATQAGSDKQKNGGWLDKYK